MRPIFSVASLYTTEKSVTKIDPKRTLRPIFVFLQSKNWSQPVNFLVVNKVHGTTPFTFLGCHFRGKFAFKYKVLARSKESYHEEKERATHHLWILQLIMTIVQMNDSKISPSFSLPSESKIAINCTCCHQNLNNQY